VSNGTDEGRTGMATTGMVLGIIAVTMSFIPIIGMVAWVLAPLAIIFGALGLASSKRGQAIAGLATGGVGLAVCMLWALVFIGSAEALDEWSECYDNAATVAEANKC
jgi:hypothetical protein